MYSTAPHIPDNELQVDFARSSGPGGQNVNKVNTKAIVRWRVGASAVFGDDQKNRIRHKLATRLNKADEIVIPYEAERSQLQNRTSAVSLLNRLVQVALRVPKKRVKTKPTRSSKERRKTTKIVRSKIKKLRRAGASD